MNGYVINYTEKENRVIKSKSKNVVANNMTGAIATTGLIESEDIVIKNALLIKTGLDVEEHIVPESATLALTVQNDVDLSNVTNAATPSILEAHEGDIVEIKAICDERYNFVGWFKGGIFISNDAIINYTLLAGANALIAKFAVKDVDIITSATVGGTCFCSVSTAKVNSSVGFYGVADDGYAFDHFEKDGQNVGTDNPKNFIAEANDAMVLDIKAVFAKQ